MDPFSSEEEPRSAVPARLTQTVPRRPAEATRDQERKRLFDSISSTGSNRRRYSADDFTRPHIREPSLSYPQSNENDGSALDALPEEGARDARDTDNPLTPPVTSRSASPYIRAPTVDFDGLSWPSRWFSKLWTQLC